MPRATWNGHLRLSLVSCPIYLSPATSETKRIRLNQINAETGNRLKQQLVDSETGKVVERQQVAKGYEHDISDEELKALQVESSKVIDLTRFVDRDEVDPVYLDAPYYVYPDGKLAVEAFQVIGQAMAAKGLSAIGKVTLANRERRVPIEPREIGLLMTTLRSPDVVRPAEFSASDTAPSIPTRWRSPRRSSSPPGANSIRPISTTATRKRCASWSTTSSRALPPRHAPEPPPRSST
jgi:DNA end-binding protein Ku